jgi:hypothetical protein
MLYFAYADDTDRTTIERICWQAGVRVPLIGPSRRATLGNHCLCFAADGTAIAGGVRADAVPASGKTVQGVVYDLSPRVFQAVRDHAAAQPSGAEVVYAPVFLTADRRHVRAAMIRPVLRHPIPSSPPPETLARMVQSAVAHGANEQWLHYLMSFRSHRSARPSRGSGLDRAVAGAA